jgi:hypothetical protein
VLSSVLVFLINCLNPRDILTFKFSRQRSPRAARAALSRLVCLSCVSIFVYMRTSGPSEQHMYGHYRISVSAIAPRARSPPRDARESRETRDRPTTARALRPSRV